jgi:hypothetical protein
MMIDHWLKFLKSVNHCQLPIVYLHAIGVNAIQVNYADRNVAFLGKSFGPIQSHNFAGAKCQ